MSKLSLENVSFVYGEDTPFRKEAVKNVSLEFNENRITALMGHTGSGKSTLAEIICGILKPTEGKVFLDGEDFFSSGKTARSSRMKMGLVFQYPEYQLFEETVFKDISFGPQNLGKSKDEIEKLVYESADFVGLDRELLTKSPFEISGGQKRRAAIAGILAMDPEILVLDEPASGLDPKGREDILSHLKNYQKEKNKTLIIISHSMEDMAKYADDVVIMKNGEKFFNGTVEEAFDNREVIYESGLDLPSISRLMFRLKEKGYIASGSYNTVESAYLCLSSILKGGDGNVK